MAQFARRRAAAVSLATVRIRLKPLLPLVIGCALVLLAALPYLAAVYGQRDGAYFRGSLRPSTDEGQYLAAIRMGQRGEWLWHQPFTIHTIPPILMYPFYLAAGHVGHLVGLSVRATFALTHPFAVLILFAALWQLARLCLRPGERGWFLAFGFCVSGLYWLDALLTATGHEVVSLTRMGMQHVSGFSLGLIVAHEGVGVAGHIAALTGLLGALPARDARIRRGYVCYGAAGVLVTGMAFPVFLPLTGIVIGLFSVWRLAQWGSWRERRSLLHDLAPGILIGLPGIPIALYYLWLFRQPHWSQFQATGGLNPLEGLLTWGALLPLAWWGWRAAPECVRPLATVLAIWCACAAIGTPFNVMQSSRFPTGINLAIGALLGLGLLRRLLSARMRIRLLLGLGLGLITQYLFMLIALLGGSATHLYVSSAGEGALRVLAAQARPHDVNLAPFSYGNVLPEQVQARIAVGDYGQTYDYTLRRAQVQIFFNPASTSTMRKAVLRATGATYVLYDASDGEDGAYDPRQLPGLRSVYDAGGVAVLKVRPYACGCRTRR